MRAGLGTDLEPSNRKMRFLFHEICSFCWGYWFWYPELSWVSLTAGGGTDWSNIGELYGSFVACLNRALLRVPNLRVLAHIFNYIYIHIYRANTPLCKCQVYDQLNWYGMYHFRIHLRAPTDAFFVWINHRSIIIVLVVITSIVRSYKLYAKMVMSPLGGLKLSFMKSS